MAIILDRMTHALGGDQREAGVRHCYSKGPAGLIARLLDRRSHAT